MKKLSRSVFRMQRNSQVIDFTPELPKQIEGDTLNINEKERSEQK